MVRKLKGNLFPNPAKAFGGNSQVGCYVFLGRSLHNLRLPF